MEINIKMAVYRVKTKSGEKDFTNRRYDKYEKQTAEEYIEECRAKGEDVEMERWEDHQCSKTEHFPKRR